MSPPTMSGAVDGPHPPRIRIPLRLRLPLCLRVPGSRLFKPRVIFLIIFISRLDLKIRPRVFLLRVCIRPFILIYKYYLMATKRQYGQYYSTNCGTIFKNMTLPPETINVIEPFAGKGHIVDYIKSISNLSVETYDIEPKYGGCIERDTLSNPPSYKGKFVVTNPPFLARNKSDSKTLYDKYKTNDLYKCFLETLIHDKCQGGMLILPINFITSIRKNDVNLRKRFMAVYKIIQVNLFEERMFKDTTYSICSIFFTGIRDIGNNIHITIYPNDKEINVTLTDENNYTIGGELYNLPHNPKYKISRAVSTTQEKTTNIMVKCIDDTVTNQLGFKITPTDKLFVDSSKHHTRRSYATLVINRDLTMKQQRQLVTKANEFIRVNREKYHSLFLSNFRDNTSIARKRITFTLIFSICNFILSDMFG